MTLNILCVDGKGGVVKRLAQSCLLFSWLLLFSLLAGTSWAASFLNAPHTEENGVFCIDCHQYPIDSWPEALPVNPTIDDTVKNFICLKCHNETGNAPQKAIHSSHIMAEQSHYPTWTTECVDCHDPHFQGQLAHFSTDYSELYLITGLTGSISNNGTDTIINYSAVSGKPGWLDPSKWNSKTGAGRGLIFVADALTPKDTFEIIAADNFSITVSGLVNPSALGSTFGIIYGQMIREQVLTAAGPKDVKFYDPDGGFTDTSITASPTGICQVCHTQTLYWTSSGNNSLHNINTNCTGCHAAAQGFRVSYHDHSLTVTSSVGCINCHNNPDIIGVYHFGNCITCHNSPRPEVIAAIASGSAECNTCHGADFTIIHPDTIGHTSIITVGTTSCANCHSDPPPLVDPLDPKVHNACISCHDINGALVSRANGKSFAVGGDCATCHAEAFGSIHPNSIDHSTIVTTTGTQCGSCHTSTALIDALDPTVHNACASCHDASGALVSLAFGQTAPGNCSSCHSADFTTIHPDTINHTAIITIGTTSCASCHSDPPPLVDAIDPKVHNDCISCHDTNGALISLAVGKSFAVGGDCATCHIDPFDTVHPSTTDHSGIVTTTGTSCGSCHTSTALIDALDTKVHNSCASCHDANGGLVSLAVAKSAPGNCSSCHTADFTTTHPATVDHSLAIQNSIGCADCHTSTALVDPLDPTVHNACASCHDASGALTGSAFGNLAPNECSSCHSADFTTIHPDTINHTAIITIGTTSCASCHSDPPPLVDTIDPKVHNTCLSCHDTNGGLISLAAGKSFAVGGDCATCHIDPFDAVHPSTTDHSGIITTTGTSCGSCHTSTALINVLETKVHNNCASCHDANGGLVSLATAKSAPGNCSSCHTADFTTTHPATVDHSLAVQSSIGCADCHTSIALVDL